MIAETIRHLTPDYAVSPQIGPEDMAAIRDLGFAVVICNRPDAENPPHLQVLAMAEAATRAGLVFVDNPLSPGAMSMEHLTRQHDAAGAAEGPVLAYCASGTRSSMLWALGQAGSRPVDEILQATGRAGYALDGLRPQIEALAGRG